MTRADTGDLRGRVVIVTGAGQGIGQAIATILDRRGATLALADLQPCQSWAHGLGVDDRHSRHTVDVRSAASCRDLVDAALAAHGQLDGLVNNAGIVHRAPAAEMSEAAFTAVLDVNLAGTFRMCQAAYPALAVRGGSIVNIGSTNGQIAVPDSVGYCVSKAGVMHLARVLALEWARDGIRANAVAPTIVATEMTADVRADPAYMTAKMASIPLGRMAQPDDVAEAVAYLLSPAAGMVTGQTIFVDGGVTVT